MKKRVPNSSLQSSAEKKAFAGLDLGTLESCIIGKLTKPGSAVTKEFSFPLWLSDEGILRDTSVMRKCFIRALDNELHLRLTYPLSDGVIEDLSGATLFKASRELADPGYKHEVYCVIGIPAVADEKAKADLKQAALQAFDGILLIPEPFLAALGMRDEGKLQDPDYKDPVSNSLFIDIGAGTTDFCIVQGYFPKAEDLHSIPFAGNEVDVILDQLIRSHTLM